MVYSSKMQMLGSIYVYIHRRTDDGRGKEIEVEERWGEGRQYDGIGGEEGGGRENCGKRYTEK